MLVEQLVHNLVRNASAYNVPGGLLEVRVERGTGGAMLRVINDGQVHDPDDVPALLARFNRGSAGQRAPGFGLGLSVVSAIASAHGAALDLRARPEGGLDVAVTFPTADRDPKRSTPADPQRRSPRRFRRSARRPG